MPSGSLRFRGQSGQLTVGAFRLKRPNAIRSRPDRAGHEASTAIRETLWSFVSTQSSGGKVEPAEPKRQAMVT